jgi:hypothetical protein
MSLVDEVDLGTLLQTLNQEELDEVLRLPFPGVRVLRVGFFFNNDRYDEDGYATVEEAREATARAVRERLADATAHWAERGRELQWRLVPYTPTVHPVERVLRAYWSANDIGWAVPDLHNRGDDGEDYGDYGGRPDGPYESDADCGITPTRRELYRGRFRNPKR